MKRFGEQFKEYKALEIARASPLSRPMIAPNIDHPYAVLEEKMLSLRTKRTKEGKKEYADTIRKELRKATIKVAPAPNIYQISPKQPDLSAFIKSTLLGFDYYLVELGLNVIVGREAKVPTLRFKVDLYSNGAERTDVTTYSIAPTDSIKRTKIVEGKISIGVNNLLKLIPGPIGEMLPNLISIDINPIEFRWQLSKYEIDASGPGSYEVGWLIYGTEIVQGFNPLMMLRVNKRVSKIFADVQADYELHIGGRISRKVEVESDKKRVRTLPP